MYRLVAEMNIFIVLVLGPLKFEISLYVDVAAEKYISNCQLLTVATEFFWIFWGITISVTLLATF